MQRSKLPPARLPRPGVHALSMARQGTMCHLCWLRKRSSFMPPNGPREPIVEAPPHEHGREETSDRALSLRIRQQEILAELGVTALKGTPFDDLLREAVRLSAEGLEAE